MTEPAAQRWHLDTVTFSWTAFGHCYPCRSILYHTRKAGQTHRLVAFGSARLVGFCWLQPKLGDSCLVYDAVHHRRGGDAGSRLCGE